MKNKASSAMKKIQLKRTAIYVCTRTILKPFSFHTPHKLKRNEKDDDEEQSFISHEKNSIKNTTQAWKIHIRNSSFSLHEGMLKIPLHKVVIFQINNYILTLLNGIISSM